MFIESIPDTLRSNGDRDEQQVRFQLALNAAGGMVYEYDLNTGRVDRSPGLMSVVGFAPEEVPPAAAWWYERVHPDDHSILTRNIESIYHAGVDSISSEYRVRHRDGSWRWVWDQCLIVRDAEGAPLRMTGCTIDTTARRQTEEALRQTSRTLTESLALLDAVLANLPVGFAFLDRELRFVRINEPLAALNGAPIAAHLGRTLAEVLRPDAAAWIEPQLREVLRTGAPIVFEHTEPHPLRPNVEGHWQIRYEPVRAAGSEILGVSGLVIDITDHKLTEAALREEGRRKDNFLAILGHELRNPLALIRNAVGLLQRHGPPDPVLVRERARIDRQVSQLARLLDDLLDVARIAQGKVRLRQEPVDLCALVWMVLLDHGGALEAAGLRLQVSLPDAPVVVLGDPIRLAQAVGNLMHNARKFTQAGGQISVSLVVEAGAARLVVRDNGVGIAAEVLARLFSPFVQADRSVERSQGGLGLGLFLVKGLVEQHGGTVQGASPGPDQGAEFTLRLPLAAGSFEAQPPPSSAGEAPATSGRRVLIIEDNPDIAESLQELILDFGHDVRVAGKGAEGVELARSFCPDVVLCDIGLPGGMDGYAVARALRGEPGLQGTTLIALTGYGQGEDRRRSKEAGFDRHLVKPVEISVLQSLLQGGS